MARSCKGVCQMLKAESLPNGMRYEVGHKRCTFCGYFFSTQNVRCPCCKAVLRTKPRGRKKD